MWFSMGMETIVDLDATFTALSDRTRRAILGRLAREVPTLDALAATLPFADALEAVSARGREMTRLSLKDNGTMAAVGAQEAERI